MIEMQLQASSRKLQAGPADEDAVPLRKCFDRRSLGADSII
jgi:hypothetical protein